MKLNNKGFAMTTIVYTILSLFLVVSFASIAILKSNYDIKKDYTKDLTDTLNTCFEKGEC